MCAEVGPGGLGSVDGLGNSSRRVVVSVVEELVDVLTGSEDVAF
jgi:hypothetical protein